MNKIDTVGGTAFMQFDITMYWTDSRLANWADVRQRLSPLGTWHPLHTLVAHTHTPAWPKAPER